jgi:hypothetical protein
MKRMTLAYSDEGKQYTPHSTMPNQRYTGIFGTGGIKATGLGKKR